MLITNIINAEKAEHDVILVFLCFQEVLRCLGQR